MSKPLTMPMFRGTHKAWVFIQDNKMLTVPEFIEGTAKGWISKHPSGQWLLEIKLHKPKHTKGRKPRYYYVHNPKKRPLVCPI